MMLLMDRALKTFFILPFLLGSAALASAETPSLYESLSRKSEVKITVATTTDISEKKELDPAVLKDAIEKALTARKSIHFKVVPADAAELAIDTEVKGFHFSETDPVDMLVGVGGTAMDAATIDHFAASEATFTVRDVKAGTTLWKDTLRASVTHHTMTEAESRQKVSERLAEMLMRAAFGKKKK